MAKFPVIGDNDDDDEQPLDVGSLARNVHLAMLIINAAIPLHVEPPGDDPVTLAMREATAADRSHLRALAFGAVLTELTDYDYQAGFSDLDCLARGELPPAAPGQV